MVAVLASLALATVACSTYTVHTMPGLAARDAAGHTEIDGLCIGAQPYQDFAPARKVFNQAPMENGLLPVLLVVENGSKKEIELTRARIELETPNGRRLEPLDRMSACREAAEVAPAAFLWVFPTTDKQAMAFDWGAKCVADLLVCKRGGTVRAFLYFRVGSTFAENGPEQCTLMVPFEHADRSKRGVVKLPLRINRRKQRPDPKPEEEFDFDIG